MNKPVPASPERISLILSLLFNLILMYLFLTNWHDLRIINDHLEIERWISSDCQSSTGYPDNEKMRRKMLEDWR